MLKSDAFDQPAQALYEGPLDASTKAPLGRPDARRNSVDFACLFGTLWLLAGCAGASAGLGAESADAASPDELTNRKAQSRAAALPGEEDPGAEPRIDPAGEQAPSEVPARAEAATSQLPTPGSPVAESFVHRSLTEPTETLPAPLPAGTKVLHVGDSFAGALGLPLSRLLEAAGVRSVLKHTDATYLTDWAWNGELQTFLWRYNPDLVIITLGGNELEIIDPERRGRTIKKLVSVIGDTPCVWVAIPLWKGPQNGLLQVIEQNAAPCVFLDTNELLQSSHMERLPDGVHPTKAAREIWAAEVIDWLKQARTDAGPLPWSLK